MGFKIAPESQVKYHKLDIADPASIQNLAKSIKRDHEAIDVLINNAGVNLDEDYSPQNVKTTLDTNVRGTLNVGVPRVIGWDYDPHAVPLDVPNFHPPFERGWPNR